MSKDPGPFCSESASSIAAADLLVTKQAECDSDSETHTFPLVGGDRNNMVAKGLRRYRRKRIS